MWIAQIIQNWRRWRFLNLHVCFKFWQGPYEVGNIILGFDGVTQIMLALANSENPMHQVHLHWIFLNLAVIACFKFIWSNTYRFWYWHIFTANEGNIFPCFIFLLQCAYWLSVAMVKFKSGIHAFMMISVLGYRKKYAGKSFFI